MTTIHSAYGRERVGDDALAQGEVCSGPGRMLGLVLTCDSSSCDPCRSWCGYLLERCGGLALVTFPVMPSAETVRALVAAGYDRVRHTSKLPARSEADGDGVTRAPMWVGEVDNFPDGVGPTLHPAIVRHRAGSETKTT